MATAGRYLMPNSEDFRKKESLINTIIDIERDMFIAVPTNDMCRCKEDSDSFRTHRMAQYIPWSLKTLESYFKDPVNIAGMVAANVSRNDVQLSHWEDLGKRKNYGAGCPRPI